MFTGAELYDRNGEPALVKGSIRRILEKYGSHGTLTDPNKYLYYLPCVTALHEEDHTLRRSACS